MKKHVYLFDLCSTPEDAPYLFDAQTDFYVKDKKESYILKFENLEPVVLEVEQGKSQNVVSIYDTIVAHVMCNDNLVHHLELPVFELLK